MKSSSITKARANLSGVFDAALVSRPQKSNGVTANLSQ